MSGINAEQVFEDLTKGATTIVLAIQALGEEVKFLRERIELLQITEHVHALPDDDEDLAT